jgi:hypothetical protein
MKIIHYSCLVGNRDIPIQDGRVYVKGCDKFNTDKMNAKAPKILPHLYLEQHDISIWSDANVAFKKPISELIDLLGDEDCLVFAHPQRTNINEEINATLYMDTPERRMYHKDKPGILGKGGVLIRRNNERVNQLNEKWWAEICRGSVRDQLSLPYTLGTIAKYAKVDWKWYPYENDYFKANPHVKS